MRLVIVVRDLLQPAFFVWVSAQVGVGVVAAPAAPVPSIDFQVAGRECVSSFALVVRLVLGASATLDHGWHRLLGCHVGEVAVEVDDVGLFESWAVECFGDECARSFAGGLAWGDQVDWVVSEVVFARGQHRFWFMAGFDAVDGEDTFEASNSATVRDLIEILVTRNRLPPFGSFCGGWFVHGYFLRSVADRLWDDH